MYLNTFKNIKSTTIDRTLTVTHLLLMIQNGDFNTKSQINELRKLGKGHPKFESLKITLPNVNWNFLFKEKVTNDNILQGTGYIYIDVDGCTNIDNTNPYIFASWKSISNTGYGILVKVDGLTLTNFSKTYIEITNLLNVKSDNGAKKATQRNIISYDEDIYINNYSTKFYATEEYKKVTNVNILQEGSELALLNQGDCIGELLLTNVTFFNSDEPTKLRFNNIDSYFADNDKGYIIFEDDKEKIVQPFFPNKIKEGERNKYMFWYLTQIALLNPMAGQGLLVKIANSINDKFVTPYEPNKITSIVASIINKRKEGTLNLMKNKERRIIFNPNVKMTKTEKLQIKNKEMGRIKTDKTKQEIYTIVEGWDFETNGKITQIKVAEKLGKVVMTIKRNWDDVKDLVKSMNHDYKNGIKSYDVNTSDLSNDIVEVEQEPIQQEIVPQIEAKYVNGHQMDLLEMIHEIEIEDLDIQMDRYELAKFVTEYRKQVNVSDRVYFEIGGKVMNGKLKTKQDVITQFNK